jgi:hypothetical protein
MGWARPSGIAADRPDPAAPGVLPVSATSWIYLSATPEPLRRERACGKTATSSSRSSPSPKHRERRCEPRRDREASRRVPAPREDARLPAERRRGADPAHAQESHHDLDGSPVRPRKRSCTALCRLLAEAEVIGGRVFVDPRADLLGWGDLDEIVEPRRSAPYHASARGPRWVGSAVFRRVPLAEWLKSDTRCSVCVHVPA